MARNNLIVNPSFRNALVGWEPASDAVIEATVEEAFYGANSARVTKSASAGTGISTIDYIPVTAGLSYAVSGYAMVKQTLPLMSSSQLAIKITWYNSSNLIVSQNVSATRVVAPNGTWNRLTGVYFAPVTTVKAKVSIIQVVAGTAGDFFDVDAIMLEQSSYVGGFLDNLTQSAEDYIINRGLSKKYPATIGGMQLNADVSIGDLVLNTVDEEGNIWVCTDIDGWWGPSSPEIPDIPRGTDDGSYDVTGRYTARQVTLSGVMIPAGTETLSRARDRLVAATNLVRKGAWLRTNEEPTRAAYVRLSGQPRMVTLNARGRTEFSIGLRAGDPIKYEWNDQDPDGLTTVVITGLDAIGEVENIGNANVTGVFELTGPLGSGTTIYNAETDETMTLVQALRGANAVATVIQSELYNEIATLTTSAPHNLQEFDIITVSGVGAPFDSVNETFTVLSASNELPYTVSYYRQAIDRPVASILGSVGLSNSDILEINTYEKSVKLNGDIIGNRSKLETLVDWISFAPGNNTVVLNDSIDELTILYKQMVSGDALLTTDKAHFLAPGDSVTISLPETVTLKRKSLTSNVATLTTVENHGFSIGDKVDVNSTAVSNVTNKALTSNVATLTTSVDGGFVPGDTITVVLPVTRQIASKAIASNVVTLTTTEDHGYSPGDSITVALATTGGVLFKSRANNAATFTTLGSYHGYSVGDSITVALPTTATITKKSINGSSVTLTTSAAHPFIQGDSVTITMPTTATITARSMAGGPSYLATLTTSAAHNFSVGDAITVNVGATSTRTVTNRVSASTTNTLTTSGAHGWVVGERITVSGINSNYNGSFVITAVTSTTVTYASTSPTESSVASSGTIVNDTIATGYNGLKYIETIPTSTTFTYLSYSDGTASTGGTVSSPTLVNNTNTSLNGDIIVQSSPTTTTFQYTKV